MLLLFSLVLCIGINGIWGLPNADVDVDVIIVGAGYAGLAAAHRLQQKDLTVHVLEATDHVGGRTRNFDLASWSFDSASDAIVEVGGTFVATGHTELIALARETGHELYNVSGHMGQRNRPLGGMLAHRSSTTVHAPPGEWPWWWWGVDTSSKIQASIFHTASGRHTFTSPADIKPMFDRETWDELEAAGAQLQAEAAEIECDHDSLSHHSSGSIWFEKDSQTFESWMAVHLHQPESKTVLRNMCRGMIAQEPSVVSFLSILKSLKGCWSGGSEDQYRIRGGTQAVPLSLAAMLRKHPQRGNITLSSPVRSIEVSTASATDLPTDPSSRSLPVVTVRSDRLAPLRARAVIVTDQLVSHLHSGPPVTVSAIEFLPSGVLGHAQAQLLQRMPMGTSMKFFVQYESAWWRSAGLSGSVMSSSFAATPTRTDPLAWGNAHFDACQEHSPYDGTVHADRNTSHFALMCWVEGETNLRFYARLTDQQRRQAVLSFLENSFNDTRARTLAGRVVAHNWADQQYARGAYTGYFPPGVQSQPESWDAFAVLSNATKGGLAKAVWLAGSDYQVGFGNGYIEGAIRSAYAAADRIVQLFE